MHVSPSAQADRSKRSAPAALVLSFLLPTLIGSCGGSSGGNGQSGIPGEEGPKPGGGTFFVDENQSGGASNLHLDEVRWGRLVDIYEIDSFGSRVELPVFTDFVVEPSILTQAASYVLDRNPVTQRERLTIQAQKRGVADTSAFDELLAAAVDALPVVAPKNDDGSSAAPFTIVPRNACVVLRFDDCLDDSVTAAQNLINTVRVLTGYAPVTPFSARVVFDPNHGAVVGGDFHTTRVLVDMTTSESEASTLPVPQGVNAIGLPARLTSANAPNVSLRLPSTTDIGSGQAEVLTNLSGVPLDAENSGPFDPGSLTLDVVRALRSGNSDDANNATTNGFLIDIDRPRVIGGWPVTVTSATVDPVGDAGFDFLLDLTFTTTCLSAPVPGDVVTVGGEFLEVTSAAGLVGSDVTALEVRAVGFVTNPLTLQGVGLYQAPFDPASPLAIGCWVSFLPAAASPPVTGVSTVAQIVARFSEPMDPETLSAFGGFMIVKGASGASSTANSSRTVVGQVLANSDLTTYSFESNLPMPHVNGATETLHVELGGARDLAGNSLRNALPFVDFTLDSLDDTQNNGAIVLRFGAADEYAPNGGNTDGFLDLRGQFNYDLDSGIIRPRPVAFGAWPADRTNPVPAVMVPVPAGVFPPLVPLGAKLQMVWRYCDLGWEVRDETKYNLDVLGLSWSPIGGLVVADFYDQFEIRLGHSRFLPDEAFNASGLPGSPNFFEDNYLAGSNPKIVHNRALGYTINPANLFNTPAGTPMMPFPLNRGSSPDVTYTWRDTSILTLGADGDNGQPGIPLGIEGPPPGGVGVAQVPVGSIADFGEVPSFGLPLLIEVKCHPSDSGLGINRFDSSNAPLPLPQTTPNFRAYSAGGINNFGNPVIVLPDTETFPKGGFNPLGTPPGARTLTSADNTFYLGELDTVVRVSRVHTVWLDSTLVGVTPTWLAPVLDPSLAAQPLGTNILLDFRSAAGFNGQPPITSPFNASAMDV
jgi:hypothetical protein